MKRKLLIITVFFLQKLIFSQELLLSDSSIVCVNELKTFDDSIYSSKQFRNLELEWVYYTYCFDSINKTSCGINFFNLKDSSWRIEIYALAPFTKNNYLNRLARIKLFDEENNITHVIGISPFEGCSINVFDCLSDENYIMRGSCTSIFNMDFRSFINLMLKIKNGQSSK